MLSATPTSCRVQPMKSPRLHENTREYDHSINMDAGCVIRRYATSSTRCARNAKTLLLRMNFNEKSNCLSKWRMKWRKSRIHPCLGKEHSTMKRINVMINVVDDLLFYMKRYNFSDQQWLASPTQVTCSIYLKLFFSTSSMASLVTKSRRPLSVLESIGSVSGSNINQRNCLFFSIFQDHPT